MLLIRFAATLSIQRLSCNHMRTWPIWKEKRLPAWWIRHDEIWWSHFLMLTGLTGLTLSSASGYWQSFLHVSLTLDRLISKLKDSCHTQISQVWQLKCARHWDQCCHTYENTDTSKEIKKTHLTKQHAKLFNIQLIQFVKSRFKVCLPKKASYP